MSSSKAESSSPCPVSAELALRLADVHDMLNSLEYDEDGEPLRFDGGDASAMDYALRGSSGCMEPDEWQERRLAALVRHADYLGLDRGNASATSVDQARAERARAAQIALEALFSDLPWQSDLLRDHLVTDAAGLIAWCKREQERIAGPGT